MEEKQSNPEIDLTYFFRPIQKGLRIAGSGLSYYIACIKSNAILFISIFILLSAAAFSIRFVINPAYKTEGILLSRVLPGKYCSQMIGTLNKLTTGKNVSLLAKNLHISPAIASTINNIDIAATQDSIPVPSIDSLPIYATMLNFELKMNTMDYIDSVQQGIVYYLENAPYALKRKEARIHSLQLLKVSLSERIKNLDSTRKLVSQSIVPRSQGQGIILGKPINPVDIFEAEAALIQEQLDLEERLKLTENIEVVQPFQQLNQTNYPKFNLIFLVGMLISLAAALVLTPILGKKPRKRLA